MLRAQVATAYTGLMDWNETNYSCPASGLTAARAVASASQGETIVAVLCFAVPTPPCDATCVAGSVAQPTYSNAIVACLVGIHTSAAAEGRGAAGHEAATATRGSGPRRHGSSPRAFMDCIAHVVALYKSVEGLRVVATRVCIGLQGEESCIRRRAAAFGHRVIEACHDPFTGSSRLP